MRTRAKAAMRIAAGRRAAFMRPRCDHGAGGGVAGVAEITDGVQTAAGLGNAAGAGSHHAHLVGECHCRPVGATGGDIGIHTGGEVDVVHLGGGIGGATGRLGD